MYEVPRNEVWLLYKTKIDYYEQGNIWTSHHKLKISKLVGMKLTFHQLWWRYFSSAHLNLFDCMILIHFSSFDCSSFDLSRDLNVNCDSYWDIIWNWFFMCCVYLFVPPKDFAWSFVLFRISHFWLACFLDLKWKFSNYELKLFWNYII